MNILICGVGKSGTTALFFRIRKTLTGTVNELFEPQGNAIESAFRDPASHVLAKILLPESVAVPWEVFSRRVMLIRDPRDILVSRLLYLSWHAAFRTDPDCVAGYLALLRMKERDSRCLPLKVLYASFASLQRQHPWREYLRVLEGLERQQTLLRSSSPFFVQRYEDLVDGDLHKLARYLDGPGLDAAVTVDPAFSRVERRGGYGDWRDWFTEEDVAFFRPLLEPSMNALGYPPDWEIAARPVIESRYCSEYAARLFADRITADRQSPAGFNGNAELLPVTPETLLRIARSSEREMSVAATDDSQYALTWAGDSISGDVAIRLYCDLESADSPLRLSMKHGAEGNSEILLPARPGDNFFMIRFQAPVISLRLAPARPQSYFSVPRCTVRVLE